MRFQLLASLAALVVTSCSAPRAGSSSVVSGPEPLHLPPVSAAPAPEPAGPQGEPEAAPPAEATGDKEALAKQLANPIASLISVPLQLNYDSDIGPRDEGERLQLNVQPVVPFDLNEDWNLISRTIVPIIDQSDVIPNDGDQSGLGDIVQSLFFSPKESDFVWGVGPVFLLPTASEDELGGEKWGIGPTGVVLKQAGPWTYGALVNHITSFAGEEDRAGIDATFLQPFVSFTTPTAWTHNCNIESTYDWRGNDWTVPVNVTSSKVVNVGGQLMSVGGGIRYWAESPDAGPEGFGFRFFVTLLFPKG